MRERRLNGALSAVPSEKNFSFCKNTTYGCGGVADLALFPRTEEEACKCFASLTKSGEKFFILGAGSDVLACDGVYDGTIICTSQLNSFYEEEGQEGEVILNLSCGAAVSALLKLCRQKGYSGAEFLAGIPASLGGIVYMNGGAGKYISECVESVRIFDGKIRELSNKECDFSYKHSTMRDIKCFILSVKLRLKRENPQIVRKKIEDALSARSHIPAGRSCGCVFENYCGVSAGKIIESAGLKGATFGKAYVSRDHANFIINEGERAEDVFRLIKYIKQEVYKKFGITLKEEVCYIGDFE